MKKLLEKPILQIPLDYVDYVPQLLSIILACNHNNQQDFLVFTERKVQGIPERALRSLWGYTKADLHQGYFWEIEEPPEQVGFWFYRSKEHCLYLSNVPYILVHHAPDGYAWGYNGSGPSDLGLNLAEYFARKHYQNLKQTELWRRQTASLLAYVTHYSVCDLVNTLLAQRYQNPAHISFDTLAIPILQILDSTYCSSSKFLQTNDENEVP